MFGRFDGHVDFGRRRRQGRGRGGRASGDNQTAWNLVLDGNLVAVVMVRLVLCVEVGVTGELELVAFFVLVLEAADVGLELD